MTLSWPEYSNISPTACRWQIPLQFQRLAIGIAILTQPFATGLGPFLGSADEGPGDAEQLARRAARECEAPVCIDEEYGSYPDPSFQRGSGESFHCSRLFVFPRRRW